MSAGNIIWIIVAALIVARLAWRFTRKKKPAEETSTAPTTAKKKLSPNQKRLYTVLIFIKISTRRYFRDRTALFFTIAFPLIFLFIFGGLFGKNSSVSFKVALLNESNSAYSQQFVKQLSKNDAIKVQSDIKTMAVADDDMSHGTIDATIVLPQGFGNKESDGNPSGQAQVLYTENNAEAGQTLTSLLQAVFAGINAQYVKVKTPFSVASKQTGKAGLSQFDYTFSGLLGFSILGLGIFGPVNTFPELKKQGVLRRFHTTPIRVWQFFTANVISQALIGLITMVVMFAVAIGVFHLKVVGNYAELGVFICFGIAMIYGIGLAAGGWAQNERQAAPLVNLITFPMMFLSGTFFPRYLMPEWLQGITNYLPLTPVIDGVRLIATEGKGLFDLGSQLGIMAVWVIVIYAIAFRVFRWE